MSTVSAENFVFILTSFMKQLPLVFTLDFCNLNPGLNHIFLGVYLFVHKSVKLTFLHHLQRLNVGQPTLFYMYGTQVG